MADDHSPAVVSAASIREIKSSVGQPRVVARAGFQLCGATVARSKVADIDPRRPEGGWCFGEGRAEGERVAKAGGSGIQAFLFGQRNFPLPPLFFALASLSSAARPLQPGSSLRIFLFPFIQLFSLLPSSQRAFSLSSTLHTFRPNLT